METVQKVLPTLFISSLLIYLQKIQELEDKEGTKTKFDKKSLMRILMRLSEKGKLQLYRPRITVGEEEKEVDLSNVNTTHI